MYRTDEQRMWGLAGAGALALVAGFCVIALWALVRASGQESSWPPIGYTVRIALFTLGQAAASTLLSLLLALPVALAMARRQRFVLRPLLVALMLLPLGLPVLPVVFGILEVWGRQGLVNGLLVELGLEERLSIYGLSGILLAHVFFNLPLAARLMLRALTKVPSDEWRLAASLDFSRWSLLRLIEGPALLRVLPGIAGLIFMLCITSFSIVLILGGGPATSTLEVAIYQALKFDFDPPRAMVLCLLQLVLTGAVFAVLALFPDPEQDRGARQGDSFRPDAKTLVSRMADGAVLLLFLLFVGAPLVALAVSGLKADLLRLLGDPIFLKALQTSVSMALAAALLAVLLATLVLRGGQALRVRHPFVASLYRLPEFTLLIPPLALGAGWFLLLLDAGIAENSAMVVVVSINAVMALPFVFGVLGPELKTHEIRTKRLADSLDLHGIDRLLIVDWPALKTPLMTAFSFAAALSLGDLGAVALFGSGDFITLPSLLYAKLGSYRTMDAAGLALILAVLCLILMLPVLRSDHSEEEAAR